MRIKKAFLGKFWFVALGAAFLVGMAVSAFAQTVPLISKDEVKAVLGSPNVVIIDVRAGKDWNASEKKIKGAIREDPEKVKAWAKKYQHNQDIIFYCA